MKKLRTARPAAQRHRRPQSPFYDIPFRHLYNPLPPLALVSPEKVEQIHEASMHILEEIGLDFWDDEALNLWHKAGARVDFKARHVRLDRNLVLELVAKAPATFTWRARNPERDLVIGSNAITFAPGGGTVFASNLDIGRRPGKLEDLQNLLRLVQMSNVLHFTGEQLIAPHDVPVSARHLQRSLSIYTLTDKAAMGATQGRVVATDVLNMARLAFAGRSGNGPVLGGIVNVNSPLRYDQGMLGGLISFARAGQVVIVTPFILAGAMSPITMAAAMAQQNAETLAGIALTQLVRPGAPAIYGGFTTNVDMKSGSPAFGTPEGAWALLIGAQLARRYKLPYRGSGGLNNSKAPDAQAAYETLWTLWPAVLAHTNFILHSVGWLEGGLTASFEKFMIDQESLAMFYHFLQEVQLEAKIVAPDMMAPVGPDGPHFGTAPGRARHRARFYEPFLSDRQNHETWLAGGGTDTAQRAYHLWKELLATYQPPPLDPNVAGLLQAYVARRERELENKI